MTGVDIASSAIDFCRRVHRAPGLRFVQGDAEDLPLFDQSADAVVNVEASFCYADLDRFFAEVQRVLRPGGYFLYADLQTPGSIDGLKARLRRGGFDVLTVDDITPNVLTALELDAERRANLIRKNASWYLRHAMAAFAGTPGSRIPTLLAQGREGYFVFTLRKPAKPGSSSPSRCNASVMVSLALQ